MSWSFFANLTMLHDIIIKRLEGLAIEKTKYCSFRVTPEEKKYIKAMARSRGMNESEYLRVIVFEERRKEVKFVKEVIAGQYLKDRVVASRLTENEYNEIEQKAKLAHINMSRFLARSALEKEITVINGMKDLSHQLSKMGNNLNQLTKLAHQGKITDNPDMIELKKMLNKIWKLMVSISKPKKNRGELMKKEDFIKKVVDRLKAEDKKSEVVAFKEGEKTSYLEVFSDGHVVENTKS